MSKTPPNLKPHQIALFDRGYVDYKQYTKWASNKTYFVTRLKDNAVYEQLREIHIPNDIPDNYITDLKVQVKYKDAEGKEQLLVLRRVVYYDKDNDRIFQFLTNIMKMTVEQIGLLYKMRWQLDFLL